jgi:hypothetical protein
MKFPFYLNWEKIPIDMGIFRFLADFVNVKSQKLCETNKKQGGNGQN